MRIVKELNQIIYTASKNYVQMYFFHNMMRSIENERKFMKFLVQTELINYPFPNRDRKTCMDCLVGHCDRE